MKNLIKILLVSFMFVALAATGVQAQDKTCDLDYDEYEYVINLGAKDTVGIADSVYIIDVYKKLARKADADMYFDLDTTATCSVNNTVTIVQAGKVLNSAAYTTINTVTWHMTADTTFTMNASAKDFGRYRYTITAQNDSIRFIIDKAETKFTEQ